MLQAALPPTDSEKPSAAPQAEASEEDAAWALLFHLVPLVAAPPPVAERSPQEQLPAFVVTALLCPLVLLAALPPLEGE